MNISSVLKNSASHIHFIGIGGVSMSSLAKLLKSDGHKISGSDINESANVKELKAKGIEVFIPQSAENIKNYDLVVYTAAVKENNPELKQARESKLLTVERCVLLGEMMKQFKCPINVSGTHGKTTTTSMLAEIFVKGDKKPTVSVGGNLSSIGGNLLIGDKDYFICEACEYVESFLKFYPVISVVLNIEEDHLDYFEGLEHIKEAFCKFGRLTADTVIYNGDDENCRVLSQLENKKLYTFGLEKGNDCRADNITANENGGYSYDFYFKNENLGRITLSVPGRHNVYNSLAAVLTAYLSGISVRTASEALKSFSGAERRFEYKGEYRGAKIYDDYAHHPSEIAALLSAVEKIQKNRLFIVFQPHTYTRTRALLNDFAETLRAAQNLIIADIYAAREKNIYNISSEDLAKKIPGARYMKSFEEIESLLKSTLTENDLLITVGAGNVFEIGENLAEAE